MDLAETLSYDEIINRSSAEKPEKNVFNNIILGFLIVFHKNRRCFTLYVVFLYT